MAKAPKQRKRNIEHYAHAGKERKGRTARPFDLVPDRRASAAGPGFSRG